MNGKANLFAAAVVLAASVCGGGAFAQGGQRGAFEDMMKVYSNLLADPQVDPQMRAQLQQMLQQVTRSRDDLSSLGPAQTYQRPQPNYQPPRYTPPQQTYTPPQQDQGPPCHGCVSSAR
jgi:hypothetical protein